MPWCRCSIRSWFEERWGFNGASPSAPPITVNAAFATSKPLLSAASAARATWGRFARAGVTIPTVRPPNAYPSGLFRFIPRDNAPSATSAACTSGFAGNSVENRTTLTSPDARLRSAPSIAAAAPGSCSSIGLIAWLNDEAGPPPSPPAACVPAIGPDHGPTAPDAGSPAKRSLIARTLLRAAPARARRATRRYQTVGPARRPHMRAAPRAATGFPAPHCTPLRP